MSSHRNVCQLLDCSKMMVIVVVVVVVVVDVDDDDLRFYFWDHTSYE